jgi:predicted negative regulator of RcsB-dependent stress response
MQPVTTDSAKLYEFLAWLELNKKRVVAVIGAALLLFLVVYIYLHYREQNELAASRALLALRPPPQEGGPAPSTSPTDLLKVASEYGSTSAGERALLLAAGNLYAEGRYADAQKQFELFRQSHSGSPLAPIAAFGIASSLDALDQVDAALGAYQSVVNQFPDDAVAARSRLAMAVLHETKNQNEQAYRIYDELSKQAGAGDVVSEAAQRLEKLQRRFPQLGRTNAPVAAATTRVNPPPTTAASNGVPAATPTAASTSNAVPSTAPPAPPEPEAPAPPP